MASLCTLLSVVAALLARQKSSFLCVRKFGVNTCLVEFKTEAVIQPNGRAVSVTPITLPSLSRRCVCAPGVSASWGLSSVCLRASQVTSVTGSAVGGFTPPHVTSIFLGP